MILKSLSATHRQLITSDKVKYCTNTINEANNRSRGLFKTIRQCINLLPDAPITHPTSKCDALTLSGFKPLSGSLSHPLLIFVSASLTEGIFPEALKTGKVIQLLKSPMLDLHDLANYRTSLTYHSSKDHWKSNLCSTTTSQWC